MPFRERPLSVSLLLLAALCLGRACFAATDPDPAYVPDPEIEKLIEQTAKGDKLAAQNALSRLSGFGGAAERALLWHLFRENNVSAKARWAELRARLSRGPVAHRVTMELLPDGSGLLTLWSNRALQAQCATRYDRLLERPERNFEQDLKENIYSKGALFDFLNDGVKHLEGRVEVRGEGVEAQGILSFRNFDALAGFAEKFDLAGYHMLAGATLSDSVPGSRTYHFKKTRETARERYEKNLLLFYDVQWEFVLDFKGHITSSNAVKTDGSKLVWTFNCYQMVCGQAQVEASFDSAGLPPRPPKQDHALLLPDVVQAGQPIAVVRNGLVRAKVCKRNNEPRPPFNVLLERGQLVELDGRDSLPLGADLKYRWKQTYGADLPISPEDLSQPHFYMVVYEAGEYGFELVVSTGGVYSKPAEVKIIVQDDGAPTAPKPAVSPSVNTPAPPRATPPTPPTPPTPAPPEPPKALAASENNKSPAGSTAGARATANEGAGVPAQRGDPKELYAAGLKLLQALHFAEAKKLLATAAELDPENRDCQFRLGVAMLECGDVAAALAKFEDLAGEDPTGRAAMYAGHCSARCGNMGDAGRWYRRGAALGKEKVMWEQRWQLGWLDLANKDYENALERLASAEKDASAANVKDYRLLYDLARALHGCHKDAEALRKLEALHELGYTPDPQFVAEVKKGAEASPAAPKPVAPGIAAPEPKPVEPSSKEDRGASREPGPRTLAPHSSLPTPPVAPEPKTVAMTKLPETKAVEQPPAEPTKSVAPEPKPVAKLKEPETKSSAPLQVAQPEPAAQLPNAARKAQPDAKKEPSDNSAIAEAVDLTNPRPASKTQPTPPVQNAPKPSPVAKPPDPQAKSPATESPGKGPETPQPARKAPPPREDTKQALPPASADTTKTAEPPPVPRQVEPKTRLKPPPPPKPALPPVPDDADKALAAGRLSCKEAARLLGLNTEEAKFQAECAGDVAEAMLQGAWAKKPGDKDILAAFTELSKHVNVIAIASNPVIKAKVRGLVVLDATQSIVPNGRPLYCVWEQVGGEKLQVRPEDLSQKKVGLRIPRAGIYKFELAVSDGSRGGNPVTVTVEVVE